MPYAQVDQTNEEIEREVVETSDAYHEGVQMGWRLACAYWMMPLPEQEAVSL